jgi:hypothetical protein
MRRTCDSCLCRYMSECAHDALVGTGAEPIEGAPQTREGEEILVWLGANLYDRGGEPAVRDGAGPCPGWRRR